jgi:hypothetical protein
MSPEHSPPAPTRKAVSNNAFRPMNTTTENHIPVFEQISENSMESMDSMSESLEGDVKNPNTIDLKNQEKFSLVLQAPQSSFRIRNYNSSMEASSIE